jgi:hypothetical protein
MPLLLVSVPVSVLCLFVCCSRRLAKPYAVMTLCHVLSSVVAAPLAAGLLSLHGRGGLAGWQVGLIL